MSEWPISPPAPVTRTTGLRMRQIVQRPSFVLPLRDARQRTPRLRVLTEQRVEIERDVFGGIPRRDLGYGGTDLFWIRLDLVLLNDAVLVPDPERVEKRGHTGARLGQMGGCEGAGGYDVRR